MTSQLRPEHQSKVFNASECVRKLHDDTSDFCDGALASNDGAIIPVHKFVMAMRSEHLKTLFFGESRLRFGSVDDDAPVALDFAGDVLCCIKSYCYTDRCDDGFSEVLTKVHHTEKVGILNERLGLEEITRRGQFLVRLTAAADYLLIPGLVQQLCKEAYTTMKFHIPKSIPVIYKEATKLGSDDLSKLAWHSYWMLPEDKRLGDDNHNDDECIFEAPDPNADYDGFGVIVVMGCSENVFNGNYYGARSFVSHWSYEPTGWIVFEKAVKDELESSIRVRSGGNSSVGQTCELVQKQTDSEGNEEFWVKYMAITRNDLPRDWSDHDDKSGSAPPTCFVFRRGDWQFPIPSVDSDYNESESSEE